jgi:hypothetical protein
MQLEMQSELNRPRVWFNVGFCEGGAETSHSIKVVNYLASKVAMNCLMNILFHGVRIYLITIRYE